jgi:hypothetical protein
MDLSLFTYPYWADTNTRTIDFVLERDLPKNCKRAYFEFLHLYSPDFGLIAENGTNIAIVSPSQPRYGDRIVGGYSFEYAKQIKQRVYEPFITLSGLGENVNYFVNTDTKPSIDFIVSFCKSIDFEGIVVNIERLGDINNYKTGRRYIKFLEELTTALHDAGLKIIFTTQTEVFNGAVYRPSWIHFHNPDIYHIPFDYINYMMIDIFWQDGNRYAGHFDLQSVDKFIETLMNEDTLYQQRTIFQLPNYAVWGYSYGCFDEPGIYNHERNQQVIDTGGDDGRAFQYQILAKKQWLALVSNDLAGADLWQNWVDGVHDLEPGDVMTWGRLEDASLVMRLNKGHVNRRGDNTDYVGETYLCIADGVRMDFHVKYLFEKTGIKRYSVWHGANDMFWFNNASTNLLGGSGDVYTGKSVEVKKENGVELLVGALGALWFLI